MKTIRLSAAAAALVLAVFGTVRGTAHAGPPHYIIKGTLAYCTGGGTACSLYTGDFTKTFVSAEGPPTGANSGKPASMQIGCWHAYPKGTDRVLDRALVTLPSVTTPVGQGLVVTPALDNNAPVLIRLGLTYDRHLGIHTTEFQASAIANTHINNGAAGAESTEHLVNGGFQVIAKGAYTEAYGYSNHVFHHIKWLVGTLICKSGMQPHVKGVEGKAYDWDAEVE